MRAKVRALGLFLAVSIVPLLAWGQACPFWHVIAFADGSKGCLSDYAFAREPVVGLSRPLEKSVTTQGLYAVAAPMNRNCPIVVGAALPTAAVQRGRAAHTACEAALAQAGMASCGCAQILLDGTSRFTKAQFDARFSPGATQVANAGSVAPSAQPRVPPSAVANPSPPMAAAVAAAASRTTSAPTHPIAAAPQSTQAQAEQAQTREMLEKLQARLQQLETARATPPGTAAPSPGAIPAVPVRPRVSEAPGLTARALVIGNSRYASFGALPNPGRDARAIAAKLQSFGIPVDLVLDAQRDDIIQALNDHAQKAAGKDVSLFFYAGHGVQVEGINYLIPVNMRGTDLSAGYVKLAGISLNAALDYLPAKTRIVFLDACRDNPATRTLISSRSAASAGLAPVNAASGTLVAYATRDGATADDGDGINSPYTTALLRHIDTPLDISLVLRQVRQTVLQLTGGKQEPWEYGSLVGEQIVLPQLRR